MKLLPEISEFIESSTKEYRDNFALDLKWFCKSLDLNVYAVEFEDYGLSGAIQKEMDKWEIFVNRSESENRQRFTIAHEVGHFISHKFGSLSYKILETGSHKDHAIYKRDGSKNLVEQEANFIAAELLMPGKEIEVLFEQNLTPEEMAEKFEVSTESIVYRLNNLGFKLLEQY